MGHVFVTGTYRSGTTLVEKALHALPSVSMASQPLPLLYIAVKRAFLSHLGLEDPHPLGTLFLEDRYTPQDLHRFADAYELSAQQVTELLSELEHAPGFWSPELLERAHDLGAGTLIDIRRRAHGLLAEHYGRPDARWRGSKEILCEEYVPYLLDRGERVVVVVRDPRAVLASVYLGAGPAYAGRTRPVLFHLRTWRKSAAFALAYAHHPGFASVRYEDLVAEPGRVLTDLAGLLELDEVELPPLDTLRDQQGRPWRGNSSFSDRGSRSRRGALSPALHDYVETLCAPELLALGYPVDGRNQAMDERVLDELATLREPAPVDDPHLAADYSTAAENLRQEHARRRRLHAGLPPAEARRWFIDRHAYARLLAAVTTS